MTHPSAPWDIVDIELSGSLATLTGTRPSMLIVRWRGAPIGVALVAGGEFPLSPEVQRALAMQACAWTVVRLASMTGVTTLARTPGGVQAPPTWSGAVRLGDDILDALDAGFLRRRSAPQARSVSVAICTRRRAVALANCLDAVCVALPSDARLIVVDNGPDDDTAAVVARFPRARYVTEPKVGLNAARNAALLSADTDIVAFVDDDVHPEPGWLGPLSAALSEDGVTVACGLVLPEELADDAQVAFQFGDGFGGMGFEPLRYDQSFLQGWRWGAPVWDVGAGANMAVDRRAAIEAGGFDERLGPGAAGGAGDDSEFWRRMLHRGGVLRYEPLSVVRHSHRRGMAALKRQLHGYGHGHVAALFTQFAYTRDWRELARACLYMPALTTRRLALAPLRRLRGRPDPLAVPWFTGVLRGLTHLPVAWSRSAAADLREARTDGR